MALCTHTRATGACRRTFLLRWRSLVTALFVVLQARIESGSCVDIDIDLSSVESADGVTDELQATVFSPPWMDDFHWNDAGCDLAKGHYEWRGHGFGSNINNLLNAWVYAIAVEDWRDLGVIITSDQMNHLECSRESRGHASIGWDCIFTPMPHLCIFDSDEDWTNYMVLKDVPDEVRQEAARLDLELVRHNPHHTEDALKGRDIDHLGALATMVQYLWSNMTPWLKVAADFVANAPETDVFDRSPFVGIHIRRGDKVSLREADYFSAEEYLSAAVDYINTGAEGISVEDIKGIWLASDDPAAVDEVRAAVPAYLPNVANSTVVWVSSGVPGGPRVREMTTRSDRQTYAELAYVIADLQRLTAANVFVGTFSSNIGKMLVVLRESIARKSRESSISLDMSWRAGRRRHRRAVEA